MFFRRATADLIALPGKYLKMDDLNKQPLTEHLTELRRCLLTSLLAVGVGFSISYYFVQDIGFWFFKPLFDVLPEDSSLIFTSYQEAFFFI
jgi:Sec-independent protein secretion pathway component TatC